MLERGCLSTATPALLHTRRGALGRTLLTTSPKIADIRPLVYNSPVRPRPTRYQLRELDAHAPWTSAVTTQLRTMLGIDQVGTTTLNLLNNSLAPTTYA
jgi:hypothetical protein